MQEFGIEVQSISEENFGSKYNLFLEDANDLIVDVNVQGERLLLSILTVSPGKHVYKPLLWHRDSGCSNVIYFSAGKYLSVANFNHSKFFDCELFEMLSYLRKMLDLK